MLPACASVRSPEPLVLQAIPAPVIAIDGPSASGKGTVASRVAAALGFHYLDSGALYRAVGLAALHAGLSLSDEEVLARLAAALPVRFEAGEAWLGADAVGAELRTEACAAAASQVAALPGVRTALLARQRAYRRPAGLVADGRDMGTVVFPDAAVKIYLSASVEQRAARRALQLTQAGQPADESRILADLRARDGRDATRAVAPLLAAPDAYLLDTTHLAVEEAVAQVLRVCRDKGVG